MTDPRAQVVGEGYDAIGERFDEWRRQIVGDPRERWLEELTSRLFEGARVLELGCGSGLAETQLLAKRFRVTGVDVSATQIRRARVNLPEARFVHADFTSLELPSASFEAVASFYSFNHVPRELLPTIFERIHGWLRPAGFFLVSLGAEDLPEWTGDFLGAPMFFSGYPPERNRELLEEAGFERLLDEVVTFQEPEREATFHWVLAQR
ncbi:MAG: methyltransferase domain-containing protein [Actinobacteria bacterium]|nr:MAG: methyltransferase domain-containing protein [Actinomycetota bacterium]TML69383.1 MAG: methyltransferase domain-containing protein [Actinomycetota bacterium]